MSDYSCTSLQTFSGLLGHEIAPSAASDQQPNRCRVFESTANYSDALLVRRSQRGDLSAFEELVVSYTQPVVNYAARIIGDRTEAEDIAQKAFVRAFRALGRFRFGAKFSTWLFAITRNLCLNELRRRARHRTEPLEHRDEEKPRGKVPPELTQVCTAGENLLKSELVEKIEEALARLPERQRTAILLLRESKISYEDIASILGTTIPATKSLIYYGRVRLKRTLLPYLSSGKRVY